MSDNNCSSYQRGQDFEKEIFARLIEVEIECYRVKLSRGDGGRDIEGELAGIPIVVQCKNWTDRVGVEVVRDMEFWGKGKNYDYAKDLENELVNRLKKKGFKESLENNNLDNKLVKHLLRGVFEEYTAPEC
ncbi:3086_t:CDS:2 [Ambispora gerdemannii]|uniref:3086_t:CDS:1 n=1 Tax=Ambispora gerdemannii TaxID=144530 RepID=A0A9N9GZH5_9GLOM|nr:3086_t:CDS:2 [Ambispora gerdemannii]